MRTGTRWRTCMGMLSEAARNNGWQLVERMGYAQPRSIQRVLDRSVWDAAAARDRLRAYVVETLGDVGGTGGTGGVLVVDETGFLKTGTKSCGMARQDSGTAGRSENCQMGVFLAYASPKGRAGIDGVHAPSTRNGHCSARSLSRNTVAAGWGSGRAGRAAACRAVLGWRHTRGGV